MIKCIFARRGNGKSSISKMIAGEQDNKIVFLSPVEMLNICDHYAETYGELDVGLCAIQNSEVLLCRIGEPDALEMISCKAISRRDFTIVIDEAEQYTSTGKNQFSKAVHMSRHFAINIIANTRRPIEFPRILTSQADQILCGMTTEPRDLEYIRYYCGKEFSESLRTLPQFHFRCFPDLTTIISPSNTIL